VIPPGVAGPEVQNAVVGVAAVSEVVEPEVVFVADLEVSEPEVFFVADLEVSEPGVFFVADLEVSEPGVVFVAVVFVAVVFVAVVAEPQASVDIAVAFHVLLPVSVVGVEVDSLGHPKFFAFPNVDLYATCSSFVEAVG
jgi:hypothetical protein